MYQLYFFCAVFGFVIVTISLLLGLFGLGGDGIDGGDVDVDTELDADVSDGVSHDGGAGFLRAFSARSLAAGVAFFGLGGLGAKEFGAGEAVALLVAIFFGVVAMWLVYRLMRTLSSFNANGAIVAGSEESAEGVVYLKIPADRGGMGKVQIVQQGRTMEYDAYTDDPEDLPTGAPIIVVKALTPSQMLVTRRR